MDVSAFGHIHVYGFFILILTFVITISVLLGYVAKTFQEDVSLPFFKYYFITSAIGFSAIWLAVEGVENLVAISVLAFFAAGAFLFVALSNFQKTVYQPQRWVYVLVTVFFTATFIVPSLRGLAMLEALFILILFPYTLWQLIRQNKTEFNYGNGFIFIALTIIIAVAVLQFIFVSVSINPPILYAASIIGQALGFVMLGIGITTSLLFAEQQKLSDLTIKDPLTGLYNRRGMAQKYASEFTLLKTMHGVAVDIDHFKSINDTFGHEAGDLVLRDFGQLLAAHMRDSDVCCRLGGEEFIILMGGITSQEAMDMSERLRHIIEQHSIGYENDTIRFTASFGVADKKADETLESIIKRADQALYKAKETGRNKVVLAK
ncbi:GGDEF domain-containing protein [Alteromonas facilis]|uniref:GGDEF domain-containing protein n=1 Tax=Alteromonas facilis TaxID=2048004 RepID=UPI000C2864B6|nr:GGDEF domain-containing protein [Alteromonas facilis]